MKSFPDHFSPDKVKSMADCLMKDILRSCLKFLHREFISIIMKIKIARKLSLEIKYVK